MGILSGAEPLMVDVRQTGASPVGGLVDPEDLGLEVGVPSGELGVGLLAGGERVRIGESG